MGEWHARQPFRRRLLIVSLTVPLMPALQGCAAPLPPMTARSTTLDAESLLAASAAAHGVDALLGIGDIAVSYEGEWRALVGRLQPALVDAGFRRRSQERLLLRDRIVAQSHTGPDGLKHVVRRSGATPGAQGDVRVWYNGGETQDANRRDATALVVDGYSLFLLGPMLLARHWASERSLTMTVADAEPVVQDDRTFDCDVLRIHAAPGLGLSEADEMAVFIDRNERLMRKVRFSLNGLVSTRGAVAEVDTFDHVTMHGVRWPTRFHERLLRPLPLPVHDWRMTGLDVNRGLTDADVGGEAFVGKAAEPAGRLS